MSSVIGAEDVAGVIKLLHDNGVVISNSKNAYEQLKRYETNSTFAVVLAYIFDAESCPVDGLALSAPWSRYRHLAGVTLKNNLMSAKHVLGEVAVKEAGRCALRTLRNTSAPFLSRAAAQIVVKVTSLTSLEWWSSVGLADLASVLLHELLPAGGVSTLGALYTLQYLMEDVPKEVGGASESIIVTVSALATDESVGLDLRKAAFRTISNIYEQSALLDWNVDHLSPLQQGLVNASRTFASCCTTLLSRAAYHDAAFRIHILRTCSLLLDYFDYLGPLKIEEQEFFTQIWVRDTIILITAAADERTGGLHDATSELISSAIDLITAVLQVYERTGGDTVIAGLAEGVTSCVAIFAPALIRFAALSEDEVSSIMLTDDYRTPDAVAVDYKLSDGDVTNRDIVQEDLLDDEAAAVTLRRSALSCVEAVCVSCGPSAFTSVMAQVQSMWCSTEWKTREVAIVLTGTVAGVCEVEMEPYLANLVQQLLQVVNDETEHVCVRSIATWTLSRLLNSVLCLLPGAFHDVIEAFNAHLQSSSRRIQHTSISALNTALGLAEGHEVDLLTRHYASLLHSVSTCLPVYSATNLSLLVDMLCRVQRHLQDDSLLQSLSDFLQRERDRRAKLFEESYANVYIHHVPNALVDKDVFAIDRALLCLVARLPEQTLAMRSLDTWSLVLNDVLTRSAFDDKGLLWNILLVCAGYVGCLPTAVLQQWLQSTSGTLTRHVCVLFTTVTSSYVKWAAVAFFNALVRGAGKNVFAGGTAGLENQLVQELIELLNDTEDARLKADVVHLSVQLALCELGNNTTCVAALTETTMRALHAADAALRSDTFGDSLYYSAQMAFDFCLLISHAPLLVRQFHTDTICQLVAQADNSLAKSEATMRLFTAMRQSTQAELAVYVPCLMRIIYSWQHTSSTFPALSEEIRGFLQHMAAVCAPSLEAELNTLPTAFRQTIMAQYGLH